MIVPRLPPPSAAAFRIVAGAALLLLLWVHAGVWTGEHGFTRLLRVGRIFEERSIPAFRATPKYVDPYPARSHGFDGQLYAQMALAPLLRDPQLAQALDNPTYRGRRILMSWLAWAGGFGRPFLVLNVFALLNLAFWVLFAWLAERLFRPHGWAGLAGYAAVLLTCGIVESMRSALTDFPSFVIVLGALMAGGTAGAGLLAAAALAREASLLGLVGLVHLRPPWWEAFRRNLKYTLIAAVPLALWITYVIWRFRSHPVEVAGGNFAPPFTGAMEKLGEISVTMTRTSSRWWRELTRNVELHALLTIVSVLTQTVFLALRRDWRSPLWRWGTAAAAYFWCISFLSWESHFTITRHALPVTLAFNVALAAQGGRVWLIWLLIGNCFVPYGIRELVMIRSLRSPPAPAEFTLQAPASAGVSLQLADGWSGQQWDLEHTWRWARGPAATINLRNESTDTRRVELAFNARSLVPRRLEIRAAGTPILAEDLPAGRRVLRVPLELPPGETPLEFRTDAPAGMADDGTPGDVTFMIGDARLLLDP